MILFEVDRLSHGCVGRPYKNRLEAIKDGSWSPWNENRIKGAFNFNQGTMSDFKRFAKDNKFDILSEDEFWAIAGELSETEQQQCKSFIELILNQN